MGKAIVGLIGIEKGDRQVKAEVGKWVLVLVVNEGWGRQIAGCPEREERDGGE